MGDKTLEQHFRGQAELIDRLLVYRFDEFDKKWETRLDSKLEEKFEAKLRPINEILKVILARLP